MKFWNVLILTWSKDTIDKLKIRHFYHADFLQVGWGLANTSVWVLRASCGQCILLALPQPNLRSPSAYSCSRGGRSSHPSAASAGSSGQWIPQLDLTLIWSGEVQLDFFFSTTFLEENSLEAVSQRAEQIPLLKPLLPDLPEDICYAFS